MADLVHVRADPGEAVDIALIVTPARPLPHHVAVAHLSRIRGIVVCLFIHLRMQQAGLAVYMRPE